MKYTIPVESIYKGVSSFQVTSYRTGTPGLITHRCIEGDAENPEIGGSWVVTHVRSGLQIHYGEFELRKDAKIYAEIIGEFADWNKDKDTLKAIEGLKEALENAYREVAYKGR